jgi:protein involved in polysaccharide export with SLBB domain
MREKIVGRQLKRFLAVVLGGASLVLSACAPLPMHYAPLSEIAQPPEMEKTDYRLGYGDEIEIKFFFTPELNERVIVRPDGKISIMFAQNIQAEGLTADELAANVRVLYAPRIKQIDLVVIVRGFASQRAYVGGEVAKPGAVLLTRNETVLQALSDAGWMTPSAKSQTVVIVRRDAALGKEKIYLVNVEELERGVNMAQNVAVKSGDVVLVPPSNVVSADRWVDQNIRQLLPFSTSAGFFYNVNGNNPTQ